MPLILVETGYLTGREDIAQLKTSAYQNRTEKKSGTEPAPAIANRILQYLQQR